MATVYLAKEERLDREVALKILTVQVSDETFKNSFLAEARLVARLEHQYIIKIYRTDVESNQFYMEMELLRGGTLKERLKKTTLSITSILSIINQIALALSYAHQQGCIHRDIKPANILFRGEGDDVVLADFGIAKLEGTDSDLTMAGHSGVGTPNYMAPEQAIGDKVDGRTDMYSLGVVLYEMLTGERLFQATNTGAIIHKHMVAEIPRLPAIYQHFQPVLDNVLSKNKNDRYADVYTFYQALLSAHEKNMKRAPLPLSDDDTRPYSRKEQVTPNPEAKSFTMPWLFWLLITVLLMSIGIGINYFLFQKESFIAKLFAPAEIEIAAFPELTPNMKLIKGGNLTLTQTCVDDEDCAENEKSYTLEIADFLMSETEVSFAQWDTCVAKKGCSYEPSDENWGRGQRPVININWYDIQEYIAWLKKETGLVYRLPTEAQWLYAAKAGHDTVYPWGNTIANNKANCDGCKSQWDNKRTAPVASFAAYGGLYDLYGNVDEWTCSVDKGSTHPVENQCAKEDSHRRILRGGSWQDEPERLSERGFLKMTTRYKTFGFRLLRTPSSD